MNNNIEEFVEALKSDLMEVTYELDQRNKQFESIKSGTAGWFLGKGLWLTGATYSLAGIRMTEATVPLVFVLDSPVWFWRLLYFTTLITAVYLWFRPNSKVMYFAHWLIPTISLLATTLALLAGSAVELINGQSLLTELTSETGLLGNALFTGYILLAQYTFLRLSVLLKDGPPYKIN